MDYQIHMGDSEDVLGSLFEPETVDLIVTSPPYYNARDYSVFESLGAYLLKMRRIFSLCERALKRGRMCIINISPVLVERESRSEQSSRIPLPFYFVPMMEAIGYEFLEDIIWEKPEGSAINRGAGFYRHRKPVAYKPNIVTEYILVFKRTADFLIDSVLRNDSLMTEQYKRTNIWRMNPETQGDHPAPFPLELPEKCIRYYSYAGETVLDPFMGSGTTGVAALKWGRRFRGIEMKKTFFDRAERRLRDYAAQPHLIAPQEGA